MLRVLCLLPTLDRAGPSNVITTLCGHLDRSHVTPLVCSMRLPEPAVVRQLEVQGVAVHSLETPRFFSPTALRRLIELVQRERIDLIHCSGLRPELYGALAGHCTGRPTLATMHMNLWPDLELTYGPWKAGLALIAFRLAALGIDHVVAVSEDARRGYLAAVGKAPEQVTVIINSIEDSESTAAVSSRVELRRSLGLADDQLAVGLVGTLSRRKGQQVLIEAAPTVLKACPRAVFFLVGDGPLRGELEAMIIASGLEAQVRLLGHRPDAAALFSAFDIVTLPSQTEGTSLAILEAMALARPVVATAVGGTPELLTHGASGLLVPPNNPKLLAAALILLATNPLLRATVGVAARRAFEELFSARTFAASYEALYQRLGRSS